MSTHRAVEKALDILLSFIPYNQEIGTVELSKKMGFHKSSASRLLHVLSRKGFLRQNLETKKYQLGPSAMDLGMAIKKSLETNLISIAKPYIDELRDFLDETIALEIFSGTNTVLAYFAKGPYPVNLAGNTSDILAVHAAAGAKAILAFSPSKVRDRVLSGSLPSLTPNTTTDPKLLQRQFQNILRHGISFDNEEHDIGTRAMGAPIFNSEGRPVAAVVVVGSVQRIELKSNSIMARKLRETAKMISKQLYYKSPFPWEK